ncbi:MAG: Gfo/Idh/MocA family oxidoreductase, partial [Candidatus Omnitrophota bacterium]|nr:Gfo/Idh/MocA family oxidoreductase [Candidatus Omnitrophota bacterium]
MKKIGIIGCGAIGTGIAEYIEAHMKDRASVAALCDIDKEKSDTLSRKITPNPVVADIERVMKESDLIIESAGVKISGEVAEKALLNKKDVLIMSTGGLLEKKDLLKKANSIGCNIYIPSGAICGIDGVRAASIGKIKKVSLTTRKPL